MMKLQTTNNNTETEKFQCRFCDKQFKRENSLETHSCERKRRFQAKDEPASRIAFQAWLDFYKNNVSYTKQKNYLDFIKSSYYNAFYKFGKYCVDVKCVQPIFYHKWLVDNKVRVDDWAKDTWYDKYLKEFLRQEDPYDALARSIENIVDYAEKAGVQVNDYFRYGNHNAICHHIVTGRISPWILYHSDSGLEFLDSINDGLKLNIIEYIDPEKWALIFHRNTETVAQIKEILTAGKY